MIFKFLLVILKLQLIAINTLFNLYRRIKMEILILVAIAAFVVWWFFLREPLDTATKVTLVAPYKTDAVVVETAPVAAPEPTPAPVAAPEPAPVAPVVEKPKRKPVAKTAAPKKAVAKTAPVKKTAAKAAPVKKPAVKKKPV